MRYMLLIHNPEPEIAENVAVIRKMSGEYAAYSEAMIKAGVGVDGARLQPAATCALVKIRDGKTQVLDGPYADTKEKFGGFYIIDVPDLDQAIAWAARCPSAQLGTVEVRPVWEMAG